MKDDAITLPRSSALLGRLLLIVTAVALLAAAGAPHSSRPSRPSGQSRPSDEQAKERDQTDKRWLDRLPTADRAFLAELIGYAPPEFTDDLTWSGTPAQSWSALRGKVVLVQSWTSRTSAGRKIPSRTAQALADYSPSDLQVIYLHTPEAAESAQEFLERQESTASVAIDAKGAYCDTLGVFKRPVNIIVDRQGEVRYVGLNSRGVQAAIRELVEKPFDADKMPAVRPEPQERAPAAYPPKKGGVGSARDMRGERAPAFAVSKWITREPNPRGKVVVIDFWATWCSPCRASIPHMNELASEFENVACFVGISDESSSNFKEGMQKHRLRESEFRYALALDSEARMKNEFRIRGIPHCVVISSDWIVRWQGHPVHLTSELLQAIVAADRGSSGDDGASARNRWTGRG